MRLLTSILLIAILSGIAEYFLPWWSIAIVAFIIALVIKLRPGQAFVGGFIAIALLWLGFSLYWDIPNHHILSTRLAKVFTLPNYMLFFVITAVIGGLVGGLAAWSGAHIGMMRKPAEKSRL